MNNQIRVFEICYKDDPYFFLTAESNVALDEYQWNDIYNLISKHAYEFHQNNKPTSDAWADTTYWDNGISLTVEYLNKNIPNMSFKEIVTYHKIDVNYLAYQKKPWLEDPNLKK